MKITNILVIVFGLFSGAASFALNFEDINGFQAEGTLKRMSELSTKVVKVEKVLLSPRCPAGMACAAVMRAPIVHTQITLMMTHTSCVSKTLGRIFYTAKEIMLAGKASLQLNIDGYEFTPESANRVRCARAGTSTFVINVGGDYTKGKVLLIEALESVRSLEDRRAEIE